MGLFQLCSRQGVYLIKYGLLRSIGQHLSVCHHDDPLKILRHEIHIMENRQHKLSGITQFSYNRSYDCASSGILGNGRLIQNQNLCIHGHNRGDCHHLPLR